MRLNQRTDIALRALIYLACNPDAMCSVHDMAKVLDVSFSHLQKAVQALAKAGFIETRRGKGGGNRLARDPAAISIGEVVRAIEPIEVVECWREDNECRLTPSCALIGVFNESVEAFLDRLDTVKLSDMCDRPMRKRLVELAVSSGAV